MLEACASASEWRMVGGGGGEGVHEGLHWATRQHGVILEASVYVENCMWSCCK